MSINAGTVYSELVLDMNRYEQGLRQAEQQMNTFATNLGNIGKSMEKAGKAWTTKVTLPIVGLGAAAIKTGMDFESGMSEVQAISGATGEDLKTLEDRARSLAKETKFSATQAADALMYMSLAGWDTKQMYEGLPAVLDLAAAANMDLATASDIVTDTMSAFQMSAEESGKAADIFAQTQAKSNTSVEQLGEAMKYAGAAANAAGQDLAETNTILGILADSGLKGSAAGTTFTAMLRDMKKNADDGKISIRNMTIALYDAQGNMRDMGDIMYEFEQATKDMTTAQRDAALGALFGEQAIKGMNIMLATGSERYAELEDAIRNSDGAAKDMAHTMMDNMKGAWESIKSTLGEAALQIYQSLLPSLEKLADKVEAAADWFVNLDEGTRETIIQMAGLAAAIGPVLLISGKMATSVSSIIGLFAKFSGASATATAATGATATGFSLAGAAAKAGALLLNPWVLGIGAATIAGVALYKHLQEDSIPAIELFGEEVSESTQKAVGGFLELNDKATLALNELNWSGAKVTEQMAKNITSTFEQMGQQIISTMQSDHEEQLATMQNFFEKSSALTKEEESEIIAGIKEHQEQQARNIKIGQEQIAEILNKAKEEKRSITEKERDEINRLQQAMTEKAIEYMSENEREQKVILERLKTESTKITAQQAAEVVRNSKEQKEQVVAEAEEQYNKTIAEIIKQRDEAGTISKEQANKLLEEATRQRNGTIEKAEQMHQRVIEEAKAQAKEHVNEVEWSTGEIKSKWTVMVENVITEGKRLARITTESFKELAIDAVTWGRNVVEGFINGVNELYTKAVNTVKNLGDSIANGIKSVLRIQSPSKVMEGVGKNVVEGLAVGIEKNSSKAIQEAERMAQATARQFDTLGNAVITALRKRYQEEERVQLDSLRKQTENIRRETDERIKEYDRELAAKLKLLDNSTNEELRQVQSQIDGINNKTKQEEKELEEQEYQRKLAAKEKELIEAKSAEEQLKIITELNQLKADRERKLLLESRQLQIEELRSEMDRIRVQAQEKRNELQMEYEEKKRIEIEKSSAAIEALDREMEATKIHFAKLLEEDRIQAEARRVILDENNQELVELLGTYNPKWQDAGRSFGENLLEGLNSTKQSIQNAVSEMLSMVGQTELANARLSSQNDTIIQAKRDWTTANEIGDTNGMTQAHARAEEARKAGGTIGINEKLFGLAKGGIVKKPIFSLLGEAGDDEAVIPLPKLTPMITEALENAMLSIRGADVNSNVIVTNNSVSNIDYDKLGQALAKYIKPSVKMENTFYSPTPLNPSEIARQNLRASRQLAMEWGV